MELEYKNFSVDLAKSFKAAEKGEGSAVIATLGVEDSDGDVITEGAFGSQDVVVLPAHDRHSPSLGKGVLMEETNLAIANFKFNLDPDAKTALEWYSSLKFDMNNGVPLQEWSFGFKVIEADFGEFQGKQVRFLRKLEVHEISPVLRGAGVATGTLALKSEKITVDEQIKNAGEALNAVTALIERVKSLNDLKVQKGQKGIGEDRRKAVDEIGESLNDLSIQFELFIKHLDNFRETDVDDALQCFVKYQKTRLTFKHLLETG